MIQQIGESFVPDIQQFGESRVPRYSIALAYTGREQVDG
jgi:hypothetical protein